MPRMKKSKNLVKKRGPIMAAIRNQNLIAEHLQQISNHDSITNLRFVKHR